MKLPGFELLEPRTVAEACAVLRERGEKALPLAGGTDLLVALKYRLRTPELLVDLKGVPDLDRMTYSDDGGLRLGPLVTLRRLAESSLIREKYPALAQAADQVGTLQVQNMGTVGGNLCLDTRCVYYNQSPLWREAREPCLKLGGGVCYTVPGSKDCYAVYCGDLAPAFIALGARVRLASPDGEREVPLRELFAGDGRRATVLGAGELLLEVTVPPPAPRQGSAYLKLRRRRAIDFPLLGVAAFLSLDGDGTIQDIRVGLTAVERRPLEIEGNGLKGRKFSDEALKELLESAYNKAHPMKNLVGLSPHYRKTMVPILLRRALDRAFQTARPEGGTA